VANRHAATAFDGEGARLHGGRWNSPGIALVYTSESPALAALELLVGLREAAFLGGYSLLSIELPDAAIADLDRSLLPPDWRSYPAPAELARLGDAWVLAGSSLALRVPSVVIEQERNLLVNPRHPDFGSVVIGSAIPFRFDERLARRR
jgi:RES domain-containing protein